jgi:hypothetical protein
MALQGFRRLLAALACIIVGAASFALSFVALRDVAVELQAVPSSLGWLVPIVIDGGVICGSAIIWSLSREQLRRPVFPFLFVATLVLVSVVVNAAHAGPSPLAKLIAALPPLILLGTLELVASQGRRLGTTQPVVASTTKGSVPVSSDAVSGDSDRAANTPVSPLTAARGLSTYTESVDELEAVSDLEAAVDEVFEPSTWVDPQSVLVRAEDGYTRPANRRRPTRVRAEQPLN